MAGMQALINQKSGSTWGNPNPKYYAIASAEFGASGSAACNSSAVGGPAASCAFYDVTFGDASSACGKSSRGVTSNCFLTTGFTVGLNSSSNTTPAPSATQGAYAATTGWDFATGIGTVNANALVNNSAWSAP
jgi:hypothetical protein